MSVTTENQPKMPKGIAYIIGNEAAERFSYYGMRTILFIFMTDYLLNSSGMSDAMSKEQATTWYHVFMLSNYFFPFLGAIVADAFWGKYKTILNLSLVYCLGHLCLAFMDIHFMTQIFEPRTWLALGLGLIAIGSGGIKPCVSAHVGDQFNASQASLFNKVFGYFYFAINFGAFFSTLLTPVLLKHVGPAVAFGLPGALMFLATYVFYLGRKEFVAMPAVGWKKYKQDVLSPEGIKAILKLSRLYLFIAFFWALYEQTGSTWVDQAKKMNRWVDLKFIEPFEMDPAQMQAINPILVMLFIPLFTNIIYPFVQKRIDLNPLRKIGTGFFIAAVSFVIVAYAESLIVAGQTPSVLWQVFAYIILTSAEVILYLTALEFSYTQAPNSMKSLIMGVFMLSISLGNLITAAINYFIQRPDGSVILSGPSYYLFFAGMITVVAIRYVFVAKKYEIKSYTQDHSLSVQEA
ncbi:MAG: POT family MFS transporter [Bdellovibrionaceae bacterium]|nr:POT family MFS transporter [Pseudobdellovibrionaceae bacterium]